ncbi:transposase [uncultured Ruegeria sp.]|uniref:IS91 family transposase n=1 Tax=uncultured Ruegeria sp. TaxID=259304 RepID=UPI00261E66DF|nr:transposase [uncultured Ruegeria sp.]
MIDPANNPRSFLEHLFSTAVAVADPMLVVPPHLPKRPKGRLLAIGAGKASARMAEAVEAYYGPCEGLVIARYGFARPCNGIEIVEAAHPVPDDTKWIACKPGFFLHVRVLSRLFRRPFIEGLIALHRTGQLALFGDLKRLADAEAFAAYLDPLRKTEWVVYAKPPFGGPEAVLAYLSRYTHRVAISNHRLVSANADTVAFRWKDYRIKSGDRMKVMRLDTGEFIRRVLMHVLPDSFHRIRHYGLLASAGRKASIAKIRALLGVQVALQEDASSAEIIPLTLREPCPECGGPMRIIEIFRRGQKPTTRGLLLVRVFQRGPRSALVETLQHGPLRKTLNKAALGAATSNGRKVPQSVN